MVGPIRNQFITHPEYIKPQTNFGYPCKICDQTLSSAGELVDHMHGAHSDRFTHTCTRCTAAFIEEEELTAHMETHSKKYGPFACPEPDCDKCYTELPALRRHFKRAHPGCILPPMRAPKKYKPKVQKKKWTFSGNLTVTPNLEAFYRAPSMAQPKETVTNSLGSAQQAETSNTSTIDAVTTALTELDAPSDSQWLTITDSALAPKCISPAFLDFPEPEQAGPANNNATDTIGYPFDTVDIAGNIQLTWDAIDALTAGLDNDSLTVGGFFPYEAQQNDPLGFDFGATSGFNGTSAENWAPEDFGNTTFDEMFGLNF